MANDQKNGGQEKQVSVADLFEVMKGLSSSMKELAESQSKGLAMGLALLGEKLQAAGASAGAAGAFSFDVRSRSGASPAYPECQACGQPICQIGEKEVEVEVKGKDGKVAKEKGKAPIYNPKVGCGGEHVKMIVFPRSGPGARFFQGLWINGKKYASNGPNHWIIVPKNAAFTSIPELIQNHDENETVQAEGQRIRMRNSGVLSRHPDIPSSVQEVKDGAFAFHNSPGAMGPHHFS